MPHTPPLSAVPARGPRRSRRGRLAAVAGTALLGALVAPVAPVLTAPAAATPASGYEMPFPCGQQWTGSTRSNHSPNSRSIDWNRPDDLGDPVVTSAAGTVSTARTSGTSGYGRYVVVDHGGGDSTVYAHLLAVSVQVGQRVDQGVQLGTVGSTGNSSGPHLHYEQRTGGTVQAATFGGTPFRYGSTLASRNCLDVPLAGDFLAGEEAELVLFRRQARTRFLVQKPDGGLARLSLGTSADQPITGDWDGSGKANPGVRVGGSSTFLLKTPRGTTSVPFGTASDRGIAGDWDGDGTDEVGVHRAASAHFLLRRADGTTTSFTFGDSDDVPVTGDWNGDGRTDVGVHDPSTSVFSLRYVDAEGTVWTADVAYGAPGHLPVTGDWDGNGRTDLGTWDPATATWSRRVAPAPTSRTARTTAVRWGKPR